MASSLILATKKLSTMLYRELTSMDSTMGRAIEARRGRMGRSFINVSLIAVLRSVQRGSSRKKTAQLSNGTAVRRKRAGESGTPKLLEKSTQSFYSGIIAQVKSPCQGAKTASISGRT